MTGPLAILADDLTGAADAGAPFASIGRRTVVLLPGAPKPSGEGGSPDVQAVEAADVRVLTSESRGMLAAEATEATGRCATRVRAWCRRDAAVRVYKKIDSTLRGHPALELRVLMDTLGVHAALVAPAFPAQGRTTVDGRQYVNGLAIEHTAFAGEVATSDLVTLFSGAAEGAVRLLSRVDLRLGTAHLAARFRHEHEVRLWIADAEDEADLADLAAASLVSPLRVMCGSAGLARAIAAASGQEPRPPQSAERKAPVLVVAGSRHAATVAQVDTLVRRGEVVVCPDVRFLERGEPSAAARTVARVVDVMVTGRSVVLSTAGLPDVGAARVDVAARLASVVAGVSDRVRLGGLVLTGGDTASAVCHALGSGSLLLTGELQPAIATGTLLGGQRPDLPVVTKAGGFGDEAVLWQAMAFLATGARDS